MKTLRHTPAGTVFSDGRQVFVKEGEVRNSRGQLLHRCRCLISPFAKPGHVASAFFTSAGTTLFLEGNQPITPVLS